MTTATDVEPVPYDQVVREIDEIIAEYPEGHTYERPENGSCAYVHMVKGKPYPGCIVGIWLHRYQHVPLDVLHMKEGQGAETLVARLFVEVKALPRPLDRRAAKFLDLLQEKQDGGWVWRRAANFAAEKVRQQWDTLGPGPRLLVERDWYEVGGTT